MMLKVLIISQWPSVKNGEYELIERIKAADCEVIVVDKFGRRLDGNGSANFANAHRDFDFAISLHYESPKLIGINTFYWVANPLEYMHLRVDYRSRLFENLRSYDDYLYNGSHYIKNHIARVVGRRWTDSGLEFFPSVSLSSLVPPTPAGDTSETAVDKIFYCGINWERSLDKEGRMGGLFRRLEELGVVEIYGPLAFEGFEPWRGFEAYRGEIPFDGTTMLSVMRRYRAVLAMSSPAHLYSETASSRVFEGIAAGVPVVSDRNRHIVDLFGDTVLYFEGSDDREKAESIRACLSEIRDHPQAAFDRTVRAQALMRERFCFEPCFEKIRIHVEKTRTATAGGLDLDVVFLGDPKRSAPQADGGETALAHAIAAAGVLSERRTCHVRILVVDETGDLPEAELPAGVSLNVLDPEALTDRSWPSLPLGGRMIALAERLEAPLVTFLTDGAFPRHDAFLVAHDWFASGDPSRASDAVHVGGFFVANEQTGTFETHNHSTSTYCWGPDSYNDHELSTMVFSKACVDRLCGNFLDRFDAIAGAALVLIALGHGAHIERSSKLLFRIDKTRFSANVESIQEDEKRGFWNAVYRTGGNYPQEQNALFDILHENAKCVALFQMTTGDHVARDTRSTFRDEFARDVELVADYIRRFKAPSAWISKLVRRLKGK